MWTNLTFWRRAGSSVSSSSSHPSSKYESFLTPSPAFSSLPHCLLHRLSSASRFDPIRSSTFAASLRIVPHVTSLDIKHWRRTKRAASRTRSHTDTHTPQLLLFVFLEAAALQRRELIAEFPNLFQWAHLLFLSYAYTFLVLDVTLAYTEVNTNK